MATSFLQAESVCTNPHNPDAEIIAAFHRWRATVEIYTAHPGDGDDPEWCKLLDASYDCAFELADYPAHGPEGLAIKAFMAIRIEFGATNKHEFDIDFNSCMVANQSLAQGVIADCIRHSPTLAATIPAAVGA